MTRATVRCAIYTRKSSEEGLDQSFNSLEAQREASLAYINSQKHEGWVALNEPYDDGGFSGGSMERPALRRLLADIQAGKLETVVVYKVDRLTRSLTDFAKIIEIFDSHTVSFVSVTQHFNTTSSMGRLTLNVLLSFAQFEREITGERIRDKIAASKKKGMWMGGSVPFGYDCVERQLIVNQAEAETVRHIFRQYLRLRNVRTLQKYLSCKQIRSKLRAKVGGGTSGGAIFSRGALYHLLGNPMYVGEIHHKDQTYKGQHKPIVPWKTWNKVATLLQENNRAHRAGKSHSSPSLLSGRLFDSVGVRFTPTHAVKAGKRYRYYTSQAVIRQVGMKPTVARFPAAELEQLVQAQILKSIEAPQLLTIGMEQYPCKDSVVQSARDLAARWAKLEPSQHHEFVRKILNRVVLGERTATIEIDKVKLLQTLLTERPEALSTLRIGKSKILKLTATFQVLSRGREIHLVAANRGSCIERAPVPSLANAVARARLWYESIVSGEVTSIDQLARMTGLTRRYVRRALQCANLSPRVTQAILTGKQRPSLTVNDILQPLPLSWREQNSRFLSME